MSYFTIHNDLIKSDPDFIWFLDTVLGGLIDCTTKGDLADGIQRYIIRGGCEIVPMGKELDIAFTDQKPEESENQKVLSEMYKGRYFVALNWKR